MKKDHSLQIFEMTLAVLAAIFAAGGTCAVFAEPAEACKPILGPRHPSPKPPPKAKELAKEGLQNGGKP